MRIPTIVLALMLLAAHPAGALIPMLPHDVVNGCFQLQSDSIELRTEDARALDALITLISPKPGRIIGASVTLVRPWPSPGSTQRLFLSDVNYQSFSSTRAGGDARTEGRVYTASESSNIVAALLPKALTTLHAMSFSEMRSAAPARCGMTVIVEAALNDPPGPYFSYDCDAQGCRRVTAL